MTVPAETIRQATEAMNRYPGRHRRIVIVAATLDGPEVWADPHTDSYTLVRVLLGIEGEAIDACTPNVYQPTATGEMVRLTYQVKPHDDDALLRTLELTFPDGEVAVVDYALPDC